MSMKAITADRYGTPDVLRYEDVPTPVPAGNELLIKIERASLNATDTEMLAGKPFFVRLGGLRAPMARVLGSDIAGTVTAVGPDVTGFQPGDRVFGDLSDVNFGGLAEFACVPEDAVVAMPDGLSMDDAAAVPQAGALALQGLRDDGRIKAGMQVLINGAGGGAGTFAVQIAHWYGADVTAVDHGDKLEMVQSIGADHVLDYTRWDFTRNKARYDLILDTVADRSMRDYRRVLRPDGAFVMIGGSTRTMLSAFMASQTSSRSEQRLGLLMGRRSHDDLLWLAERVLAGEITPVIGARYPLESDGRRDAAAGGGAGGG